MIKTGVMLCGHGSRDRDAVAEFERLAAGLKLRLPEHEVDYGYLEFARPIIRDGLESLVARGVKRILAVPGMLFAAGHVKNDIPWELNSFAAAHPDVSVQFGADLGIDPNLLRAATDRIEAALARADVELELPVERAETLLLVIGRGTSDPDANGNIAKVARMLWEGLGFGWAEVGYSGVALPRVGPALDHAIRLGYRRIVVFPYFLFTGVLVKRVYETVDEFQAKHPSLELIKADYLSDHPLVVDSLLDRVAGITKGDNAMNCMLCKYRTQLVGYEGDAGAVQAGHHHHVRGIGVDGDDHPGHHDHGHGPHGHGHGHHAHEHHDHGHGHAHDHGHDHGHHHDHGSDA